MQSFSSTTNHHHHFLRIEILQKNTHRSCRHSCKAQIGTILHRRTRFLRCTRRSRCSSRCSSTSRRRGSTTCRLGPCGSFNVGGLESAAVVGALARVGILALGEGSVALEVGQRLDVFRDVLGRGAVGAGAVVGESRCLLGRKGDVSLGCWVWGDVL